MTVGPVHSVVQWPLSPRRLQSFFSELPRVESELRRGAQLPTAAQLPPQQLAHIDKRLKAVRGQAHRRWVRLKYLEHRVSWLYLGKIT